MHSMIAEDQYLETKVMTATPWQLHLMVVDAAFASDPGRGRTQKNDFGPRISP
jgi:hypothetical protein